METNDSSKTTIKFQAVIILFASIAVGLYYTQWYLSDHSYESKIGMIGSGASALGAIFSLISVQKWAAVLASFLLGGLLVFSVLAGNDIRKKLQERNQSLSTEKVQVIKDKDNLATQIDELLEQLKKCEEAKTAPVPTLTPTATPVPTSSGLLRTSEQFVFTLKKIERERDSLNITLSIVNQGIERELDLAGYGTRIFSEGIEYKDPTIRLANRDQRGMKMPPNISINATILFKTVGKVDVIETIEIIGANGVKASFTKDATERCQSECK